MKREVQGPQNLKKAAKSKPGIISKMRPAFFDKKIPKRGFGLQNILLSGWFCLLFLVFLSVGLMQPALRAQNRTSTLRSIGLALPGILFQYNGSPSDTLSSLSLETAGRANAFTLEDAQEALGEWGIGSRLGLLRQLHQLLDGGSNRKYLYLKQIYAQYKTAFQALPSSYKGKIESLYRIDSPQLREVIRKIWGVYHDLNYQDLRRIILLWKMEGWLQTSPRSIAGWDWARVIALVRWGYDVGYLSEQEAWPYIERASSWVMQNFASWNQYAENYIYGRLFEYAGTASAAQLLRDSALIWWELITPQANNAESPGGAWLPVRLQAYSEPQDSFYLQLYRELYQFQQAVRSGKAQSVQRILDQPGTIIAPEISEKQAVIEIKGYKVLQQPLDQPGARGMQPISLAAIASEAVMNLLVNRGFRYRQSDRNGRSVLHWAARNGSAGAINLSLKLGLDPNQKDNQGKTPFHFAARYNSSTALYHLLQNERKPAEVPGEPMLDNQGYTPLHEAIYNQKDRNTFGILLEQRYNRLSLDARAGRYRQTPLMLAAALGNAEQIIALLQRGGNPNARDARGWTPLHYAAQSGSTAAIRLLLSDGSDVNARTDAQQTPLLLTVREADSKAVALLLQAGANVRYADTERRRPIHWAAFNSDIDVLELLLQNGADPEAEGPNAQTPMHFAAELGSVAHLKALKEAGARTNPSSRFGFTPLMIAVSKRNYEALNYLVNNGADLNRSSAQNTGTSNLVVEALQESDNIQANNTAQPGQSGIPQPRLPSFEELAEVQPSNQPSLNTPNRIEYFGWSPITLAARQGDYQMIWSLVEAGADFKSSSVNGWYPVHLAASVGTAEVLSYLISRGADISLENAEGLSPLELAASDLENGAQKIRLLLRSGADIKHLDKKGWGAMTYAAMLGNREVVRLLLNYGVDPNAENVKFPPLVAAAYSGKQEIIFLLLQRGADPNLRYKDQGTQALHYAVALNRPVLWGNVAARSIPAQLIQAGAEIDTADSKGNTPLFWAARWGNANIVKLLLDNNANTSLQNQQQLTAFDYALENHYGPARYLIDSFPLVRLNQLDSSGMTPLLRAARFGSRRLVALLLSAGADVRLADVKGYNALLYALFADDAENISTLLRGGLQIPSSFRVVQNGGESPIIPLIYAVQKRAPPPNISVLLDWLDKNQIAERDENGENALHYAAKQKDYAVVALLLERGADPDALGADDETPLMGAIRAEDTKLLRLLLKAGADAESPGREFETPLQVAVGLGNIEIADLLRSYGARGVYDRDALKARNEERQREEASLQNTNQSGAPVAPRSLPKRDG